MSSQQLFIELGNALRKAAPSTNQEIELENGHYETKFEIRVNTPYGHQGREGVWYRVGSPRKFSSKIAIHDEATFLKQTNLTLTYLNDQRKVRLNQARATFTVAFIALVLGILLVFIGVICIFVV